MFNNHTIIDYVATLLKKFNIDKPSIDVLFIASKLKINVSYEKFDDDISGLLILHNGKTTIAVNEKHHINRQRFTIAHELGHFILHTDMSGDEVFFDDKIFHRKTEIDTNKEKIEIEANKFAAELLMPKFMLENIFDKDKNFVFSDELDFYLLAKKFEVSEQAMGFRLGKLGLFF